MIKPKFTSTIAGASIFITLALLISRGLGLFREAVLANFFGLTTDYDLYLVAAVLPITITSIIFYVAQNYFIPGFNANKNISEEMAIKFSGFSFWLFVIGGTIIGVCLLLMAESFLLLYVGGTSVSKTAVEILKIMAITIPFSTGSAILSAYLQANFEFKSPTLTQLMLNIMVIILVLFYHSDLGVKSIAYGHLAGVILQLLVLGYIVQKKIDLFSRNFFNVISQRQFVKISFLTILIIEIFGQFYTVMDRFCYSKVDPGGIAALNYAYNIYLLPISIISLAISTAIFPAIAKTATNDNVQTENHLKVFFTVNTFMFAPIIIILIFYGDFILQILFERGKFSSSDTAQTFPLLKIYSISLIFFSTYAVINKIFYSKNLVNQLLFISLVVIAVKVILNIILVNEFKQNGLAMATSASLTCFFIFSYIYIMKKIRFRDKYIFVHELLLTLFNGILSYLVSRQVTNLFYPITDTFFELLGITFFVIIYFTNAVILNLKVHVIFSDTLINILKSSSIKTFLKNNFS